MGKFNSRRSLLVGLGSIFGAFTLGANQKASQVFGNLFGSPVLAQSNSPKTITFWANAFIPKTISGYTQTVPAGTYKGKTMIPGPIPGISDCFLTDQRGFSSRKFASSRMHSEITFDLTTFELVNQKHRCGPTVEIDCEDGDVECMEAASTDKMRFYDIQISGNSGPRGVASISVKLNAAANNECASGSPDIDYRGTVNFLIKTTQGRATEATVSFDGFTDPFPAFEMYASFDNRKGKALVRRNPAKGKTPWNLVGNPNVTTKGSVTLSA